MKRAADEMSTPEDVEQLKRMLQPLDKEQLVDMLARSATTDAALKQEIHSLAESDPGYRKLFVRGLAWETTSDALKSEFSQFGEIEEAVVITDRQTGKSRGFGFVTFKAFLAAQEALKEPNKMIDNRSTTCSLDGVGNPNNAPASRSRSAPVQPAAFVGAGSQLYSQPVYNQPVYNQPASGFLMPPMHPQPDRERQAALMAHDGSDPSARKLFVRGLSWDTSSESLRQLFSRYGELEEGGVATDRSTGKSRGFGFVTFRTAEGANAALGSPPTEIDGRHVQVHLACLGKGGNGAPQPAASLDQQSQLQQQLFQQMQMQQMMGAQPMASF